MWIRVLQPCLKNGFAEILSSLRLHVNEFCISVRVTDYNFTSPLGEEQSEEKVGKREQFCDKVIIFQ